MKLILTALMLALICPGSTRAQESVTTPTSPEEEVTTAVTAYVNAFNQQDAPKLASLWSADAVYTNRLSGEVVTGRMAIQTQFEELFKAMPKLKLEVTSESIQMLSPNVAVEHGTAKFLSPEGTPEEVSYMAVYTKRDGQWLLDRVTDGDEPQSVSHSEKLKVLEWMVGSWIDTDDEVQIETTCQWAKNQNFLVRSFRVSTATGEDMAGMQVIGYDAAKGAIKSWTFDSDGGFAEANWVQKNDRWYVHNKGVLANGQAATMVNVIQPVDENSFRWQTVERTVAGHLLPNVNEVLVTRVPTAP